MNAPNEQTKPAAAAPPSGIMEAGVPVGRRKSIQQNKWWMGADVRQDHVCEIDAAYFDDFCNDPSPYLKLRADKLLQYDRLEVRTSLGELVAYFVVAENQGGGLIRLVKQAVVILNEGAFGIDATGDYYCRSLGPKRWCIIGPTGRILKEGLWSRESAEYEMRLIRGTGTRPAGHPAMG